MMSFQLKSIQSWLIRLLTYQRWTVLLWQCVTLMKTTCPNERVLEMKETADKTGEGHAKSLKDKMGVQR